MEDFGRECEIVWGKPGAICVVEKLLREETLFELRGWESPTFPSIENNFSRRTV